MNNQGVNTDTGGGDRVFAPQRVVDPCDFSMAQYWQHNQHQFLSHQDVNINSSSAYELLQHQNEVYPTNDLNQHQYMSHQGGHTDICSLDELFAQWSAFIKDQSYDQHQLMIPQGGNINTSNAHELLPQQNDIEPMDALMMQEQHFDQHKLMSHQGVRTNTNGGDRLFSQQSGVEKSYLSMTQGKRQELLPQQNDSDALITQDQHHDQHQFMCYQGVNSDTYYADDSFFSDFSIEELQELLDN
ncbi:hypothetical protein EJD97_020124 [Solanum chilense]|uniref:Uncharacterized protein n=1 Tax=Solanum chilense TaxID=4083 RepID=A0A6N2ADM4_SOLCI|nr:hypothetical protein EJD97_020124 [Solanum chilense]